MAADALDKSPPPHGHGAPDKNPPPDDAALLASMSKEERRKARKAANQPAHEIRFLRSEAKRLEFRMQQVAAKWLEALPNAEIRLAACELAAERVVTRRIETQNEELRSHLSVLQMQYAMLQQALADAPLDKLARSCGAMFDRLHAFAHLGTDLSERVQQLQARCDLSIRLAPTLVDQFAHPSAPELQALPPLAPFSRTSTAGIDGDTLVANVFMCKIPVHEADAGGLRRMFDAALVASERIYDANVIQSRIGMVVEPALVHQLGVGRHYSSLTRHDGPLGGSVSTVSFAAEFVSDELAVVAVDYVDRDDVITETQRQRQKQRGVDVVAPRADVSRVLVLTKLVDAAQSQQQFVLLRRLLVVRYTLPPHSPLVVDEIRLAAPLVNGDLLLELLSETVRRAVGSQATAAATEATHTSASKLSASSRVVQ